MAMYSVNQVRNLYVATEVAENLEGLTAEDAKVGAIALGTDAEKTKYMFFQHKGHGGITRSDLINFDSVMCVKHIPAKNLGRKLMQAEVKLSEDVNEGKVIPGQDYILRIVIRQFAGMSDEDTYIKHAVVHGTAKMAEDAGEFYKELALSLAKNFSRELTKLFTFEINGTEITPNMKKADIPAGDSVIIKEVAQGWTLGVKAMEPVYFDVYPTTVTFDGDEVIWGEVDENTGKIELEETDDFIPNSKKIADLEYFCHGERGDIYRNVGWPDVIPTKYLVDPEDKDGYDVLEIHFAFKGGGENPQLSEKDIEIVGSADVINDLIGKIPTDKGFEIIEIPEKK